MGAITRQLIGEIDTKLKGQAYTKALNDKLSQANIAKATVKTQPVCGKKK